MAQYQDPNNSAGPSLSVDAHKGAVSRSSWILLAAAVVAVVFSGVFWYESYAADNATTKVTAAIAGDQAKLNALSSVGTTISSLDTQGTHLSRLFTTQKRWETVLNNIQAHLYRKMLVTALDLTADGSVNLSGVTDNHVSYAALYSSLTDATAQQYFTSVKPVSVSTADNPNGATYPDLPASVVTFSFSLKLTPAMFTAAPVKQ